MVQLIHPGWKPSRSGAFLSNIKAKDNPEGCDGHFGLFGNGSYSE
jgi:hypothetical protein